jgi:hypothetical protein
VIIKKLFKTEQEFLDFAWSWISFDCNIWNKEDLPLLEPFFNAAKNGHKNIEWTEEVKSSFDHYMKCRDDYADQKIEIKNALANIGTNHLYDFFFVEDLDDELSSRELLKINSYDKPLMKFPLVFVGWVDSTSDRSGRGGVCFSEYVCLDDFK